MPETIETLDEMRAEMLWRAERAHDGIQTAYTWETYFPQVKERYRAMARAIRLADEAAGIVSVPKEPTKEMADDGGCECPTDYWFESEENAHEIAGKRIWNAMLAASPFQEPTP